MLISKNIETAEETNAPTETDTQTVNEPDVNIEPLTEEKPIDYAVIMAAKRAARLAEFKAESLRKEKELEDQETRLKLKLLSEEERNEYYREQARANRLKTLEENKDFIRQRRRGITESRRIEHELQLEAGFKYQQKLEDARVAAEEAEKIKREVEAQAAESIRLAQEAKRIADEINAEAERFADEARRRKALAESVITGNKKKTTKTTPNV